MLIIGLLGVLIGMIIEHGFENMEIKDQENEPEVKTVKIIEINDNRKQEQPEDYFEPF